MIATVRGYVFSMRREITFVLQKVHYVGLRHRVLSLEGVCKQNFR